MTMKATPIHITWRIIVSRESNESLFTMKFFVTLQIPEIYMSIFPQYDYKQYIYGLWTWHNWWLVPSHNM